MRAAWIIGVIAACGGGERAPAPASTARLPSIEARPAAADDPVVAKVDGRNIYGSCVAAQARAHHQDKQQALDDCIGLELLAGVAAQRGLDRDPDVALAYRRALVSREVELDFTDRYKSAADLPPAMRDAAFEKYKWRMHRPEYRYSVYVRGPAKPDAPAAVENAAHAFAIDVYARVKDRSDLFPVDLYAAADAVAHGYSFEELHEPFGTGIGGPGHPEYTRPLFAIPSVGMVSPPTRTPWGWDVILWTDTMPALESSQDEVLAWLFPQLRQAMFEDWVNGLIREQGLEIRVNEPAMTRRYGGS